MNVLKGKEPTTVQTRGAVNDTNGNINYGRLEDTQYENYLNQSGLQTLGRFAGNVVANTALEAIRGVGSLYELGKRGVQKVDNLSEGTSLNDTLFKINDKDDNDFANVLTEFADKHQNPVGEIYTRDNSTFDMGSASWWAKQGQSVLPTVLEFVGESALLGTGIARAALKLGEFLNVGIKGAKALQLGAQGLTSYAVTKHESYMMAAQSYKSIYTDYLVKYQEQNPGASKSELLKAQEEAKSLAADGANYVDTIYTALALPGNLTGLNSIFANKADDIYDIFRSGAGANRQAKLAAYKEQIEQLTIDNPYVAKALGKQGKWQTAKRIGWEANLEGFEELEGQFSQEVGENKSKDSGSSLLDGLKELDKFFKYTGNEEGALNYFMGTFMGASQTAVLENIPVHKINKLNEQGEVDVQYKNGEPVVQKRYVSSKTRDIYGKQEIFKDYKDAILRDINHVSTIQAKLAKETNPFEREELKRQLFHIQALDSIERGLGENFINSIQEINNVDNTKSIAESLQPQVDQLKSQYANGLSPYDVETLQKRKKLLEDQLQNDDLAETVGVNQADVDDLKGVEEQLKKPVLNEQQQKANEQIIQQINELNKKITDNKDVTQAVQSGLAKNKEDNEYKRRGAEAISEIRQIQKLYDENDKRFNTQEKELGLHKYATKLQADIIGAERIYRDREADVLKEKANLQLFDNIDDLAEFDTYLQSYNTNTKGKELELVRKAIDEYNKTKNADLLTPFIGEAETDVWDAEDLQKAINEKYDDKIKRQEEEIELLHANIRSLSAYQNYTKGKEDSDETVLDFINKRFKNAGNLNNLAQANYWLSSYKEKIENKKKQLKDVLSDTGKARYKKKALDRLAQMNQSLISDFDSLTYEQAKKENQALFYINRLKTMRDEEIKKLNDEIDNISKKIKQLKLPVENTNNIKTYYESFISRYKKVYNAQDLIKEYKERLDYLKDFINETNQEFEKRIEQVKKATSPSKQEEIVQKATEVTETDLNKSVLSIVNTDENYNNWSNIKDSSDRNIFIDQINSAVNQLQSVKDKLTKEGIEDYLKGIKAFNNKEIRSKVINLFNLKTTETNEQPTEDSLFGEETSTENEKVEVVETKAETKTEVTTDSKALEKLTTAFNDASGTKINTFINDNLVFVKQKANEYKNRNGGGDKILLSTILPFDKNLHDEIKKDIDENKDTGEDFLAAAVLGELVNIFKGIDSIQTTTQTVKEEPIPQKEPEDIKEVKAIIEDQITILNNIKTILYDEAQSRGFKALTKEIITKRVDDWKQNIDKVQGFKDPENSISRFDSSMNLGLSSTLVTSKQARYKLGIEFSKLFMNDADLDTYNRIIKEYEAKLEELKNQAADTKEPVFKDEQEEIKEQEVPKEPETEIENLSSIELEVQERSFSNDIFSGAIGYMFEDKTNPTVITKEGLLLSNPKYLNVGDTISLVRTNRHFANDREYTQQEFEETGLVPSPENVVIEIRKGEDVVGRFGTTAFYNKKFLTADENKAVKDKEAKDKQIEINTTRSLFFNLPVGTVIDAKIIKKTGGFHKRTVDGKDVKGNNKYKRELLSTSGLLENTNIKFALADKGTNLQEAVLRYQETDDYLLEDQIANYGMMKNMIRKGVLFLYYPSAIPNKSNLIPAYVNKMKTSDYDTLEHILNSYHLRDTFVKNEIAEKIKAPYTNIYESKQLEAFLNQYFGFISNFEDATDKENKKKYHLAILKDGNLFVKTPKGEAKLKFGEPTNAKFFTLLKEWTLNTNKNVTLASDAKMYASGINQLAPFTYPVLKGKTLDFVEAKNYNDYVSKYVETDLTSFSNADKTYFTRPTFEYDIQKVISQLGNIKIEEAVVETVEEVKQEVPIVQDSKVQDIITSIDFNDAQDLDDMFNNIEVPQTLETAKQVLYGIQNLKAGDVSIVSSKIKSEKFKVSDRFKKTGNGYALLVNQIQESNKQFNSYPVITRVLDDVMINKSVLAIYQLRNNTNNLSKAKVKKFWETQRGQMNVNEKFVIYNQIANSNTLEELGNVNKNHCK